MANLCLAALEYLRGAVLAPDGINPAISAIAARDNVALGALQESQVLVQNIPADLADENEAVVYPNISIYSKTLDNVLLEKFAKYSGPMTLAMEVRVSAERYLLLERELARYVEAATEVLGARRGQWTPNLAYNGGYKVEFKEVRLGGKNFIQSARIEAGLIAHQ